MRTSEERTLYVHIGIPKTASSWLQSQVFCRFSHLEFVNSPRSGLFDSSEDLQDGGWLMASVFKRSSHIWESFGDAIFEEMFGDKNDWRANGRDALISDERIGRQGSRSVLLSGHLAALKKTAMEWGFEHVKVIFLIRRQDTWLASHYAQMSDRKPLAGQADFERFLNDIVSPQRSRYNFGTLLDYGSLHSALVAAIGADNVIVWPYEYLQNDAASFLGELACALDTPVEDAQALLATDTMTTENVRSEGRVWKLRRKPPRFGFLQRSLLLSNNKQPTIELTDDLSVLVRQEYSKENTQFLQDTGFDLGRYGYFC